MSPSFPRFFSLIRRMKGERPRCSLFPVPRAKIAAFFFQVFYFQSAGKDCAHLLALFECAGMRRPRRCAFVLFVSRPQLLWVLFLFLFVPRHSEVRFALSSMEQRGRRGSGTFCFFWWQTARSPPPFCGYDRGVEETELRGFSDTSPWDDAFIREG